MALILALILALSRLPLPSPLSACATPFASPRPSGLDECADWEVNEYTESYIGCREAPTLSPTLSPTPFEPPAEPPAPPPSLPIADSPAPPPPTAPVGVGVLCYGACAASNAGCTHGHLTGQDDWCAVNCANNNCPATHCTS